MKYEEEFRLSFYKEIATVDEDHNVILVQHTETGKVYVRKTLEHFDRSVFEFIKEGRFQGIPVVQELISSDDKLIVIEDYISGQSIAEILEEGPLTEDHAVSIITSLCDTLEPLHSHDPSIIHRDIKDSNVIIDNEGKVYLIDFDASKKVIRGRNRDTDLIGTENYAAPEQYGFGQSDQRTDIYSLGILLNRLLTGRFPSEEIYSGELAEVITKATSLDPKDRYQNVGELRKALKVSGDEIEYSYEVDDRGKAEEYVEYDAEAEDGYHISSEDESLLVRFISHLPYPIRELPGFRSGSPSYFCIALLGYALLIALGFGGIAANPEYTPAQNKFYDAATFSMIILPVLYIGNYLGIRDRMPWRKTARMWTEAVRICVGTAFTCIAVLVVFIILAMIFHI